MNDSIFTRIIKGDLPSYLVYEDDRVMAIMDIYPAQKGQVVLFTKAQVDHFIDLGDDDYMALMAAVKKVAVKMHDLFPDARIGVQIEGFEVPHAHVKVFPIRTAAEFRASSDMSGPDYEELAQLAQKLKI